MGTAQGSGTETKEHKLGNGLKLLGEINPNHKSAAIGFFVRTGARDETTKEAGISHFLEHMVFKGTAKRSALDVTYHLGNIGAQANAFTSEEMTVYYSTVLPEYFPQMQELLSDMIRPALANEEFDTEKKVILEEIALYQDRPNFYLYEHALADYFAGHAAGNSVLGSTASVGAISRDEMKAYFDRRYSPSNMILVGSGKFDWSSFVADAEKYCSAWPDFPATRDTPGFKSRPCTKEYRKKKLNQAHVLFIAPGAAAQEKERYALAVLATILGDSSGSKMYWQLVDTGLAEAAGADSDERDGTGIFTAYACTKPELIEKVSGVLRKIISAPLDFTDQDLTRAKTKIASKVVLNGELPMGRLMSLGSEWLYRSRIHNLKEELKLLKSVSLGDIQAALNKYPLTEWSEFRLLPE